MRCDGCDREFETSESLGRHVGNHVDVQSMARKYGLEGDAIAYPPDIEVTFIDGTKIKYRGMQFIRRAL